jgi:AraC family transcriptional regulator of adaptative response/methylated-DNA-[protein]-cysteine methyltransferase
MLSALNLMPVQDDDADVTFVRIGRAIRYLSEHYLEQPDLAAAAKAAALSPFHFQRLFTRYVGVSPKAFIANLTLEHAKADLVNGASVFDAALDAGLSGSSRLHDLCLKVEAMTPGVYARGGEGLTIRYGFHPSLFGTALIMATDKGVCGLAFGDDGEEAEMLSNMTSRWPRARFVEDAGATKSYCERIFATKGEVPIVLIGTPWQIKVWRALLSIPRGKVTTYRALAEKLCDAKATRATGAAVGRNPISWLIPCHRVLGSDGALTGYHWGVARKRAMLAYEASQARPSTSAME